MGNLGKVTPNAAPIVKPQCKKATLPEFGKGEACAVAIPFGTKGDRHISRTAFFVPENGQDFIFSTEVDGKQQSLVYRADGDHSSWNTRSTGSSVQLQQLPAESLTSLGCSDFKDNNGKGLACAFIVPKAGDQNEKIIAKIYTNGDSAGGSSVRADVAGFSATSINGHWAQVKDDGNRPDMLDSANDKNVGIAGLGRKTVELPSGLFAAK